jgi:hypothetical protein
LLPAAAPNSQATKADERWIFPLNAREALPFEGVFPLDFGWPGTPLGIGIEGLPPERTAVLVQGRAAGNSIGERFDLAQISPDFAETVEYLEGVRGWTEGFNNASGAINAVPALFNTNRPYLRIRFSQAPYDFLLSDGVYSQNISRPLNAWFGFYRQSQGDRYLNSRVDYWNLRAGLHWTIDSSWSAVATENFTHDHVGIDGGVDLASPYTQLFAVYARSSDKREFRHDLNATLDWKPPEDSSARASATIYYSPLRRQLFARDSTLAFANLLADQAEAAAGATLRARRGFGPLAISASAEFRHRSSVADTFAPALSATDLAVRGEAALALPAGMRLGGDARIESYGGTARSAFGATLHQAIGDHVSIIAELGTVSRVPTFVETSWHSPRLTGAALQSEIHRYAAAGFAIDADWLTLSMRAALRTIDHPITAIDVSDSIAPRFRFANGNQEVLGTVSARAGLRAGAIHAEGTMLVAGERTGSMVGTVVPRFSGSGELRYETKLADGHFDFRGGIRGQFMSAYRGRLYLPIDDAFVPFAGPEQPLLGTSEAFVAGRIGNAYVQASVVNLFDSQYYLVPVYPVRGRSLILSVTWAIID